MACVRSVNSVPYYRAPDGWEDEVTPIVAVNPAGITDGFVYNAVDSTGDFQDTKDHRGDSSHQTKHGRKNASEVHYHWHCYFSAATLGTIRLLVRWRITQIGEASKPAWQQETIEVQAPGVTGQRLVPIKSFDLTGCPVSTTVQTQVTRLAQSDPLDTYAGDVQVISLDWHWQRDIDGSQAEGART